MFIHTRQSIEQGKEGKTKEELLHSLFMIAEKVKLVRVVGEKVLIIFCFSFVKVHDIFPPSALATIPL